MPLLEIKNLKKGFCSPSGEVIRAVDIPSFGVGENEDVALLGYRGCGKTTFLRLIAGLLKPDSGKILYANQNVANLSEPERDRHRANNIGYIFQTFNLLQGLTVYENVMIGMIFGGRIEGDYAKRLLDKVGLSKFISHKPYQISARQQYRVIVARAMVGRPKLVLADEPAGNLDPKLKQEAISLIRHVCRENGAALLAASHDPSVVSTFATKVDLNEVNKIARMDEK